MLLSFLPQFKVLGSNIMVREASFKVWLVRGGNWWLFLCCQKDRVLANITPCFLPSPTPPLNILKTQSVKCKLWHIQIIYTSCVRGPRLVINHKMSVSLLPPPYVGVFSVGPFPSVRGTTTCQQKTVLFHPSKRTFSLSQYIIKAQPTSLTGTPLLLAWMNPSMRLSVDDPKCIVSNASSINSRTYSNSYIG